VTPIERMRVVLQAEADAIRSVVITADYLSAAQAIECASGHIVTTGMGKAGLMARKFAATLSSGGTSSLFVHPGDAAHGDLGVVRTDDVIVAFSTSGKTSEVLEMLSAARRLYPDLTIIGITSHEDAPLRSRCDLVLDMGPINEPCPLGLTPSASTAVMLAVSDAIALAVLEMKGTTRQAFGARHRAGYLGAAVREGLTLPPCAQCGLARSEHKEGNRHHKYIKPIAHRAGDVADCEELR
jgi:arabinose-5-phosphate isomerase